MIPGHHYRITQDQIMSASLNHDLYLVGNPFGKQMSFYKCFLKHIDFSNLNLQYADFTEATVYGCDFRYSDMRNLPNSGCIFRNCDFRNAKFEHAAAFHAALVVLGMPRNLRDGVLALEGLSVDGREWLTKRIKAPELSEARVLLYLQRRHNLIGPF